MSLVNIWNTFVEFQKIYKNNVIIPILSLHALIQGTNHMIDHIFINEYTLTQEEKPIYLQIVTYYDTRHAYTSIYPDYDMFIEYLDTYYNLFINEFLEIKLYIQSDDIYEYIKHIFYICNKSVLLFIKEYLYSQIHIRSEDIQLEYLFTLRENHIQKVIYSLDKHIQTQKNEVWARNAKNINIEKIYAIVVTLLYITR
jgi:hypothetical protein